MDSAVTNSRQHGQVRRNNNLIENALRPSAADKKNFLFIGYPDAGQRSAINLLDHLLMRATWHRPARLHDRSTSSIAHDEQSG